MVGDWFEVVVIAVARCNNYLATLLFGASSNILHHFFSAPTFRLFSFTSALQPVAGRLAGARLAPTFPWLKTCSHHRHHHQAGPGPGPGLALSCFISYITYHAVRPGHTTISYTSQSNTLTLATSLTEEIIPPLSSFFSPVQKCLHPPSGASAALFCPDLN